MIYKFLEKDEVPKPTITLDYSFGRKANKNLVINLILILIDFLLAHKLINNL